MCSVSSRDVPFPPFWTQLQPLHKFSARVLGAFELPGALALYAAACLTYRANSVHRLAAVRFIVPFWIHRAFAFVLTAFEAPSVSEG